MQGGTTTSGVFDGDLYRQSVPVSTTIYYERDPNGRLLVLTDGSKVYYYGLDGHGSVNNVTDTKGNVLDRYHYDPYGNATYHSENASIANPWQYAGGYYDAESGVYLLGVRYYDPKLGRFLQQDPLGTPSDSQYAYAGSDPCNNSDPSGATTCYYYVSPDQVDATMHSINDQMLVLTLESLILGLGSTACFMLMNPELGYLFAGSSAAGFTLAAVKSHEYNNLSQGQGAKSYASTGVEVQFQANNGPYDNEPCPQGSGTQPEFSTVLLVSASQFPDLPHPT